MAKKLPDLDSNSGLGDITSIIHNQGPVSDLSWLAVDAKEYREFEALPRQNIDVIPELVAALTYGKDDVPSLIPLRPHTTVNTNPLENKGPSTRPSSLTAVRDRVASYVIANLPNRHIQSKLQSEFSHAEIKLAKDEISGLLNERGLLGNIYVDAKHFPRCV